RRGSRTPRRLKQEEGSRKREAGPAGPSSRIPAPASCFPRPASCFLLPASCFLLASARAPHPRFGRAQPRDAPRVLVHDGPRERLPEARGRLDAEEPIADGFPRVL